MNYEEIIKVLIFGFPVMKEMIDPAYPLFLQSTGGLVLTLIITLLSLFLGGVIAIPLAVIRSRPETIPDIFSLHLFRSVSALVKHVSILCTEIFRGLPIMIIVLLVFYFPYVLFKLRLPGVILAVFAFSVYAGVYLSDILLSGFKAVDQNRMDAAKVIGLSPFQTLLHIKIPIAVRTMIPAILGTAVTVLKDSSVLMVVAVPELTFTSRQVQMSDPRFYAVILSTVILLYWTIAAVGSCLIHCMEVRWGRKTAI